MAVHGSRLETSCLKIKFTMKDMKGVIINLIFLHALHGEKNVFQGTTSPGTKLHIKASANDGINTDTVGWGANAFARIFFKEGGSPDYGGAIGYDPAMDSLRLTAMDNGTDKYNLSIKFSFLCVSRLQAGLSLA